MQNVLGKPKFCSQSCPILVLVCNNAQGANNKTVQIWKRKKQVKSKWFASVQGSISFMHLPNVVGSQLKDLNYQNHQSINRFLSEHETSQKNREKTQIRISGPQHERR